MQRQRRLVQGREWLHAGLVGLVLLLAMAAPARSQLQDPVRPQDEGLLLVYPERILDGAVPNKDFESVYGSASLWTVAAVFGVVGKSVTAERIVGLAYHVTIVGALVALAWRRRGGFSALFSGLLAILLLAGLGLAAFAWLGALALGAVALLLLDVALENGSKRAPFIATGACLGLALSFRLDFGLAVLLTLVALLVTRRRALRPVGLGMLLGLVPLAVDVFRAGAAAVVRGQISEPIFESGPGRRLPLSELPTSYQVLLALCVLVAIVWTLVGAVLLRRDPSAWIGAACLVTGALEIGMLPQAFQRADATHVLYVACFILPTAVMLPWPARIGFRSAGWAALAAACALAVSYSPAFPTYRSELLQGLGLRYVPARLVEHAGRSVPVSRGTDQENLARLLVAVDANSQPGTRVFVGPRDLRRTNYNDTFLYFLLQPDLVPSSFYLEMNPGVANAEDSRLAGDLRGSDLLILTTRYDRVDEPNASRDYGPDLPNAVVRSEFTRLGRWGPWELLARNTSQPSKATEARNP